MRIAYVMIVHNGEPFIKYQLDSIYEHADEIIIVEGAIEGFRASASPEGRSLDRTVDIVKEFPDAERKIVLITREGFYSEKLEMCNEQLKYVSADVIWHVDVDEFYMPETHAHVRKLFEDNPELDRVSFNFLDFFATPRYCISGYGSVGLQGVNRVHRFTSGEQWASHRPPHLLDVTGSVKDIRCAMSGDDMQRDGHIMFHGTLLFQQQAEDKMRYYKKMWPWQSGAEEWIQRVWKSYEDKLDIAGLGNSVTWLRKHDFPLPIHLQQMLDDLSSGGQAGMLRDCSDLDAFIGSSEGKKLDAVASALSDMTMKSLRGDIRALLSAIPIFVSVVTLKGATRARALHVWTRNVLRVPKRILQRYLHV